MSLTRQLALLLALSAGSVSMGDTIVHSADTVLLSSLLSGGSLSVGDKTFTNFNYSAVGDMPPATAVNVIPIVMDGDYGLRFQGGFIDTVSPGASDSLITFSVSAPGPWISGAVLAGNVDTAGTGGVASVTETFIPELTTETLTITSAVNLVDSLTFSAPVQTLNVQKDIILLAGDAPATLSFVDQAFPQVPEPSAGLMMIFGVLGLTHIRRRR